MTRLTNKFLFLYIRFFARHLFLLESTCRSSDDHSPGYDRTGFYDRVSTSQIGSRSSETSSEYIRRNSYHSNDRGRQRDRQHFRNSPYSLIVDRWVPLARMNFRWLCFVLPSSTDQIKLVIDWRRVRGMRRRHRHRRVHATITQTINRLH